MPVLLDLKGVYSSHDTVITVEPHGGFLNPFPAYLGFWSLPQWMQSSLPEAAPTVRQACRAGPAAGHAQISPFAPWH